MSKWIADRFYICDTIKGTVVKEVSKDEAMLKFGVHAVLLSIAHNKNVKSLRPSATRPSVLWHEPAEDGTTLMVESVYENAKDTDTFSIRNGYEKPLNEEE